MTTRPRYAALALVVALVLVACGGDDGDSADPSTTVTTTAPVVRDDPALAALLLTPEEISPDLRVDPDTDEAGADNVIDTLCEDVSLPDTWRAEASVLMAPTDQAAADAGDSVGQWIYDFAPGRAAAFVEEVVKGVDSCNAGDDPVGLALVPFEGVGDQAWVGEYENAEAGAGVVVYVVQVADRVLTLAELYGPDGPHIDDATAAAAATKAT